MGASTRTITILSQMVWGGQRVHLIKVSCTDYGTDGVLVSAADCGLLTLTALLPFFRGTGGVANGPVAAWWDETNGVVILLKSSNAGVDAGTNITTAGFVYALAIGQ